MRYKYAELMIDKHTLWSDGNLYSNLGRIYMEANYSTLSESSQARTHASLVFF